MSAMQNWMPSYSPPPLLSGRRRDWYWFTPALAIGMFILIMSSMVWWLTTRETAQRRDAITRDTDGVRQVMRLRLLAVRDRAITIAREVGHGDLSPERFSTEMRDLMSEYPEVLQSGWIDTDHVSRWSINRDSQMNANLRPIGEEVRDPEAFWTFDAARDSRRPAYSRPYLGRDNDVFLDLHIPIYEADRFIGTVSAVYSLESLLSQAVPREIALRYKVSIVDEGGNQLASSSPRTIRDAALYYEVPIDPPGYGIVLRAYAYRTQSDLPQTILFWVVMGLSGVIIWSLFALWRHTRFRAQAEAALVGEATFRRAMENSVLTGMRAIDFEGRIIYVNPAFCRMVGWSEAELIGINAPFPYWPSESVLENMQTLSQVLSGESPSSGYEVELQRKDGSRFFSRMYVSPLIDQHGAQTGWMTSITDITERKRARQELEAAHERFMTVLQGLDDAISVVDYRQDTVELLFTNQMYQRIFGMDSAGHLELAHNAGWSPSTAIEESCEVYSPNGQRWFEVRHRSLNWVDGRQVSMQVARDITARREAEEVSRVQLEKVQITSRLITLGEMASSLAHELNQPLTAISNYSMGTVARLRAGVSDPSVLLPVLEKTSAQAERAGLIIRRIREFVKRSEPNRQPCTIAQIAENAVGFADLDASKRKIRIVQNLDPHLPAVQADRILIEQVLLNLLKNAIDAMAGSAHTEILLVATLKGDKVEVSVTDRGHGISEASRERLFEPFYSTKPEGMGMGLNICRTIIEFHHGRLWAESPVEGGCVFKFTLPVASTTAEAVKVVAIPVTGGL